MAFGGADTRDIVHFCDCHKIFEVVGFVHHKGVSTQFLKCHHIVALWGIQQIFQLRFQVLFLGFQLLHRQTTIVVIQTIHLHFQRFNLITDKIGFPCV